MRISGKRERPSLNLGFCLAVGLLLLAVAPASAASPPWEIVSLTSRTTDEAEANYTAAGGHPFQNRTAFEFSNHVEGTDASGRPLLHANEELKDASVTLEPGFIGNPAAMSRCPISDIGDPILIAELSTICPPGSRVGTVFVRILSGQFVGEPPKARPLYNIVTERGFPAQFAFKVSSTLVILSAVPLPRTESYGLTIGSKLPNLATVVSIDATFCSYGAEESPGASCNAPSASTGVPFLSNPLDCSNPQPTWSLLADSYENAGTYTPGGPPDLANPAWLSATITSPAVTGCDDPLLAAQFNSTTIATKPLQPGAGPVQADSPSGLAIDLDFPQSNDPTDPETEFDNSIPQAPEPKDIAVKLPAGLSLSPSSADGLGVCSDLASDPAGDQVHYDSTKPVTCPDSSKIGSAVATSPLLALRDPQDDAKIIGPEPIPGDVYLLKPHPGDLPPGGASDGRFRLLIQLENPGAGVNVKLPGVAVADKDTGQLTMTFAGAPQLPARHVQLTLRSGPRAPLATPVTCGSFTTTADIVPWSTPGTPDATPSASFDVTSGPNGSACAGMPARRPFSPALVTAGPDSAVAGAASPFTLKLTRHDGEGELGSLDITTPPGFTAKLAGVPYCSEAAIAVAATRSGGAEAANPSCPAASQIGTIAAGSGSGPSPYYVNGKAYLAGPYKSAPLSFVFIAPAVAGPFDLGTVVVRAAIFLDPETAQMTISSDPLPRILDGMPLRLRSILARIDRPDFTRNPTNCEPMSVNATVNGSNGASASPSNAFQVGGCKKLGFKPKLALRLLGPTHRGAHPRFRATLTPRAGDANIARAAITLPAAELLESSHIRSVCSRARFAAGSCPRGAVYGRAEATSPLLDGSLRGPVYLRNNPAHRLPDLIASLDGQVHLDVVAGLDSSRGRIRASFDTPDLPLGRLTLTLSGGDRGLIVNTGGLCGAKPPRARAGFTAQSGAIHSASPLLRTDCAPRRSGSR